MTTLREAAKMAMEALNNLKTREPVDTEIAVLRAALASETVPSDCSDSHQPVAWMVYTLDGKSAFVTDNPKDFTQDHQALPLYTAPPQHQAEPVVWQFRMRPDWVRDKDFWEPWENCTKEQAANYQRVPHLHDWTYESRSLYTHPPQRQPLTDDDLFYILHNRVDYLLSHIEDCGTESKEITRLIIEFARAIERAHGIGEKK